MVQTESDGSALAKDPANDASQSQTARIINSADLLAGEREVLIRHDEQTYRLQLTRNGKLILIK